MWTVLCAALAINPEAAESVQHVVRVERPVVEIIHIRDWHLVRKEAFAADTKLAGVELDQVYEEHLATVKAVQQSQRRILAGEEKVFAEGLTHDDHFIFSRMIDLLRKTRDDEMLLRIGAAGQLMVEEKLSVLPCENHAAYIAANPVKEGEYRFDAKANEAREDDIVRNLLQSKRRRAVVVLGGAHDLTDNVKRLSDKCSLTVITPKGYPKEEPK